MIDKLDEVERRFERLNADLSNPQTLADSAKFQKVAKERSSLEKLVDVFRRYKAVVSDLREVEGMLETGDADSKAYARELLPDLKKQRDDMDAQLKILL